MAVKLAHVPLVYQVPAPMMQPFCDPSISTIRLPFPENAPPVLVGAVVEVVAVAVPVVVEVEPPPPELFGRYLTPVLGQVDFVPSGSAATNSPVWTDPRTL